MPFKVKAALYIGFGVLIVFALLIGIGIIPAGGGKNAGIAGTLVVWDTAGRDQPMRAFFANSLAAYPGLRVDYVEKNPETYQAELIDALASGAGPDIFLLSSELLAANKNKIAALSLDNDVGAAFWKAMPDGAAQFLSDGAVFYGAPWSVDTLALFYNRDYLNSAAIPVPPATWQEFQDQSQKLKRLTPIGTVERAGASFGVGGNVKNALDIYSALVMQLGSPFYDHKTKTYRLSQNEIANGGVAAPGAAAAKFYTDFANPNSPFYTWNSLMPDSLEAFALGKAAFYIGRAADIPLIVSLNTHLNFATAPLPQLEAGDRVSYGRFEFFTVSKLTKNPGLAWFGLIGFFDKNAVKPLDDALGLPPAHRELVTSKPPNALLQPFYGQVLAAKTWAIPNFSAATAIIRDMLDSILAGKDAEGAVRDAETKLQLLSF